MQNVIDLPDAVVRISGDIIATGVSYDDFLHNYEGQHVEWVNGVVIRMASIDERHDALVAFLRTLFSAYLEQTGGGRVVGDPMIMRLVSVPSSRAPDLQVLLPERLPQLKRNEVVGPANLVVEIVSPGSQRQDRVDKYREYELGGVPEYWLIDPAKHEVLFFHLTDMGIYEMGAPDATGHYRAYVLKRLWLPVDILWREQLPGIAETLRLVEAMLQAAS
ncbi:MAG TPA: Uma2 family endonuclease [Phototrophicaceae bacterium]|nr:Uma2 family endonuclease [Phototrophicaceae bacterium]